MALPATRSRDSGGSLAGLGRLTAGRRSLDVPPSVRPSPGSRAGAVSCCGGAGGHRCWLLARGGRILRRPHGGYRPRARAIIGKAEATRMTGIVRRFIEHGSYMAEQGFIGWPLEGSAELQAARAQLWDCLVAGLKDGAP